MSFSEQKIEAFLEQLSSKEPVPGGGGVSALTGALAAGLAQMVCSLTVGKKRYAEVEPEICETARKLEIVRKKLVDCMTEDASAFEPLSRAYGLPKNTEEEIKNRDEVLAKCLLDAAMPPLHICQLILEMVPLVETATNKGSRLAVSDAGCAAALAEAALKAAALNVYVNTRLMKDSEKACELNSTVQSIMEKALPELADIYKSVTLSLI